jgi:glycerol-3-phosphate acyltransferase PlsY
LHPVSCILFETAGRSVNLSIIICLFLFSFFCGAIPTGYLLLKAVKHQDIREIGSGNIGSTNVKRAAGTRMSLITQIIDILKGLIPVAIGIALNRNFDIAGGRMLILSGTALAAVLGHDFSPFLGFRGGKGVNTTIGAFLLLAPLAVISAIVVFYALRLITPVVSLRSLILGITLAIAAVICGLPPEVIGASWIAAILIFVRHIENIQRLIKHQESGQ